MDINTTTATWDNFVPFVTYTYLGIIIRHHIIIRYNKALLANNKKI